MKRHLTAVVCAFCLTASALCQRTSAEVPVPSFTWPQHVVGVENYIVYKDRAFAVSTPILVSGPTVSQATWSPDGLFMILEQARTETNVANTQTAVLDDKPLKPDSYLSVYSLNDGKVSDVMRLDENTTETDIQWIPGSDKALVVLDMISTPDDGTKPTRTAKLYVLDAASGSIKEFSPWAGVQGDAETIFASVSPTQSYAFLSATFREPDQGPNPLVPGAVTSKVALMTADELHVPINPPEGYGSPTPIWSEDGSTAYVVARPIAKTPGSKSGWFKVSLINGSLTKSDRPSSFYLGGERGGLITVRDIQQSSTNQKVTKLINTIWLETLDPDSQNRMMLAGDATGGAVNKTLQAASYISQGSLYIRPIVEVPKRRFDEELAAWNRSKAMDKARQAGLAFLMFAGDNDDTFPSSRDKWEEMLEPYLRDSSELDGFVYSLPGGPVADIANPSGTQLGYVGFNDGRAVVYVDGHVKWVPNP